MLMEKHHFQIFSTLQAHTMNVPDGASQLTCRILCQPDAPQCSKVISRSSMGDAEALPGYAAFTASITWDFPGPAATIAPPTGTMKFLSVLWTTASTRPFRQADVIRWQIC